MREIYNFQDVLITSDLVSLYSIYMYQLFCRNNPLKSTHLQRMETRNFTFKEQNKNWNFSFCCKFIQERSSILSSILNFYYQFRS